MIYCSVLQLKPCYSRHYRPDITTLGKLFTFTYLPV